MAHFFPAFLDTLSAAVNLVERDCDERCGFLNGRTVLLLVIPITALFLLAIQVLRGCACSEETREEKITFKAPTVQKKKRPAEILPRPSLCAFLQAIFEMIPNI